jgi:Zn-dependent peptidase ImmA (M78 family)
MNLKFVRLQAENVVDIHGGGRVPIDVKAVAQSLGLEVAEADLGPDVSGLLVSNGATAQVYVQKKDPEVRKRFTIAHEIGHHFLKHQFESGEHVHVDKGNYISQRGPRASEGIDFKEIEANQFAASLLMPTKSLRQKIANLSGATPLLDHHVTLLAKEFGVSEQAMTIRLTGLELL